MWNSRFLSAAVLLGVVGCNKGRDQHPSPAPPVTQQPVAEQPQQLSADSMTFPTLGAMPIPSDNPQTDAKIALGRQLFFDKRLSVDGTRACYSCHQQEDGTAGHEPIAIGARDKKLSRHSPPMWNVGYLPRLYWDGRAASLEAQGMAAWVGGNMGVAKEGVVAKAKDIGQLPEYRKVFDTVFPKQTATPDNIIKAIAAFERTLVCNDTAYDRYAKGDKSALDAQQKHGLELFMGKAGCAICHAPPHFSIAFLSPEGAYFNAGVGTKDRPEAEVDVGRMAVTKAPADWAAFKPPSLRNVAKRTPYFHDGSVVTLEAALRFMASGGALNKHRTPLLSDKKLSDAEIRELVNFLTALNCTGNLAALEPKTTKH